MPEITTMRIWIAVSIAWPLLSILVFDRWFLLSPFGFLLAFGLPIGGWYLWWKFFGKEGKEINLNGKETVGKGLELLKGLKKNITS